MKLFTLKEKKLKSVDSISFKLEKEIQAIVENNLYELFDLRFVKSEFSIKNFRIDTLGYDEENKSFVIIEYKKDKNYSVIDQGYTYMSLMLNNKSDFILEYNENCGKNLKRDDVDWSQSRVMFISPHFTEFQKHSINFKDVPFEIWEIKQYENGLIGFIQHKTTSDASISTISTIENTMVDNVSKEVRVFNEEYHLNKSTGRAEWINELYLSLKNRILNLGEVEIIYRGTVISFRRKRPFCDIVLYQKGFYITINMKKGMLNDPNNLTKDVSNIGHWGNGDYQVTMGSNTDLDYVMFLVNQSFQNQD
jgi:predicted transport protein/RecB family endonuclease NucS